MKRGPLPLVHQGGMDKDLDQVRKPSTSKGPHDPSPSP